MKKIAALMVSLFVLGTGKAVMAQNICLDGVDDLKWMSLSNDGMEKTDQYLAELAKCENGRPDVQDAADTLAAKFINALDRIEVDDGTRRTALFIERVLFVTASAGYPSSQHNYAAIHNADPRGNIRKLVRQDQGLFLHWTRKAAAQGEMRAMFNLAMRMASDVPVDGVEHDKATAYILLRLIQDSVDEGQERQLFGPYLDQSLKQLRTTFGKERVVELEGRLYRFDLSTLAPR